MTDISGHVTRKFDTEVYQRVVEKVFVIQKKRGIYRSHVLTVLVFPSSLGFSRLIIVLLDAFLMDMVYISDESF